jgi:hypothetical protein
MAAAAVSADAQTAPAFPFTFYIHDTTGVAADTPFPSIYQFPSTSLGSNSHVVLKVVNTSNTPAVIGAVIVTASTDSVVANTNFTVTGQVAGTSLPVGGSNLFTVNFSPTTTGPITAYMLTSYQVQENGCDFTSEILSDQCPSGLNLSATLTAMATAPQLVLSYLSTTGSTVLQPSGTPLSFANTSTGASSEITLTLSNQSSVSITVPPIAVQQAAADSSNFFALDVSQVPATISAGLSANFTIIFTPATSGSYSASLVVGSLTFALTGSGTQPAFPFTYYIYDSTTNSSTPLLSTYQFPDTPADGSSAVVINAVNTSNAPAFMGQVLVTSANNSVILSPNFGVSGLAAGSLVAAGKNLPFTLNFSPLESGPLTGYLQTSYQVQQNGCDFTSTTLANQCPSGLNVYSTLNGLATNPQLVLSYQASGVTKILQANSLPVAFPDISAASTSSISFTLFNQAPVTADIPAISIAYPTFTSTPFLLNLPQPASSLLPGTSENFTITFEPGQAGFYTTSSLVMGSNTYPLSGHAISPLIADISSLTIHYSDGTGAENSAQHALPTPFTMDVPGKTNVLTFTVMNPSSSSNAVLVPSIAVIGSNFTMGPITSSLTGGVIAATSFPYGLAVNETLTFVVTFAPTESGTSAVSLIITGLLPFPLGGQSPDSPLPAFSLSISPPIPTSQSQPTVTVELASPASQAIKGGFITLAFTPKYPSVPDDKAISFVANSLRILPLSVAAGARTAVYTDNGGNAISALPFQTGTTAGTITFSVGSFVDTPTFTSQITIAPALITITSASSATRSDPNLVVSLTGYDNTDSAGKLTFTFYDVSGNLISSTPYDATSNFHNYFFGIENAAGGGAFTLQATFPVVGDVNKVGSVGVTLNNTMGQTITTLNFQ